MTARVQSESVSYFETLERRELFAVTALQSPPEISSSLAAPSLVMPAVIKRADAAVTGSGLTAQYFSDANFGTAKLIRTDGNVNLKANAKDKVTKQSNSVSWSGTIVPKYSEPYTFTTVTKGGSQLAVNGQPLIDQLQGAGGTISGNVTVDLTAGQRYDISFRYSRHGGAAAAKLLWHSPSQAMEVVPQSALFPNVTPPTLPAAAGTLVGQYYKGENFDQMVMSRADPAINFNFGAGTPTPAIPTGSPFSIRWTGQIKSAKTGVYTFASKADDGIRVWVDGQLIIDDYHDQAATKTDKGSINLTAGQAYSLRVDYYQNGNGVGSVKLEYSLPGGKGLAVIPSSLYTSVQPSTAGVLSATLFTSSEVDLSWTGSSTANGYEVDRKSPGGDFVPIASTAPNVTTFADVNLLAATEYDYRILPLGSADASSESNVLAATTLTASPGSLNVTAVSATEVDLSWSDVQGEVGFDVLESTDGGNTFSTVGITPQGTTAYSVLGLTPGASYQFEVEALNADLNHSAASPSVKQNTTTLAPTIASALGTSASTATVNWTDVTNETGFTVERSLNGIDGWATVATPAVGTLTFTDAGLSPGTIYFYRVRGVDSAGASSPSITATALTIPDSPVATVAGLSSMTTQVAWSAVASASQYIVQRSANGTDNWSTVATVPGSSASTQLTNLAASTLYYYRVQAVNGTGTSAPSSNVSQETAPLSQFAQGTAIYGVSAAAAKVYAVDMTNGTSTPIGQLHPGAFAADRDPVNGDIYYFVGNTSSPLAYRWDPTTGNNQLIATADLSAPANRGTFDSTGLSWITDTAGNLYTADVNTGTKTLVAQMKLAGVPLGNGAGNMSFSPAGTLYLASGGTLYTVNTTTAALTAIGALGYDNVNFTFGQGGLIYFTTPNGNQYSLNPSTLVSSLLGSQSAPPFNSLTAAPQFGNLSIAATASSTTFTHDQSASFFANVTNGGPNAAAGGTTVTVALGVGLTFTSVTGTGWTATTSGTTVTLTYSGTIAVNTAAPTATLHVAVSSTNISTTGATFTVTGVNFDNGNLNNTAVVAATIV